MFFSGNAVHMGAVPQQYCVLFYIKLAKHSATYLLAESPAWNKNR